jgi:hypothetical protein
MPPRYRFKAFIYLALGACVEAFVKIKHLGAILNLVHIECNEKSHMKLVN